jgi:death-on-curing protein
MGNRIQLPDINQISALHDRVMISTGGPLGVRSFDALAGAWARAQGREHFEEGVSPTQLAATLSVSIAKAHGFVDGNKRAAYGALSMSLSLNGIGIDAPTDEIVGKIVEAAAGDGSTGDLEDWLLTVTYQDPVYQALFDFDMSGPEVA